MRKLWKIGALTVGVVAFLMFIVTISPIGSPVTSATYENTPLKTVYHIEHYRPGVGILYEADVENLITNNGMNMIRDKMAGVASISVANVTYIGLSNDSETAALTDENLSVGGFDGQEGEHVSGGLERAHAMVSFGDNVGTADPGNWSLSYKWTASLDFNVWKFGVFNGTTLDDGATKGDTLFSVGNFSTNVSMQANDELTVNVTFAVS